MRLLLKMASLSTRCVQEITQHPKQRCCRLAFFSLFVFKPLTTNNAILAGNVDVSHVQTNAKSHRHLFGNWTTSLTHVRDLSSALIGCMVPSVSISQFLCLPGLRHHSSLLLDVFSACDLIDMTL